MPLALECEDGHQVVDRIMDVAAIGGPEADRHPPLPEQRHDVIEPQRAEVPHVGRHQVAERPVSLGDQRIGILRRDAPVLSLQRQRIRRRSDSGAHAVQRLVGPGFRTARIHADGVVAVEPDRHAEFAREALHAAAAARRRATAARHGTATDSGVRASNSRTPGCRRIAQLRAATRASPSSAADPRARMCASIASCSACSRSDSPRSRSKARNACGPCGAAVEVLAAEMLEQQPRAPAASPRDARVVHVVDANAGVRVRAGSPRPSTMRARLGALREFRQRLDGDVQHVQEVPRRRAVRTEMRTGCDGNSACSGFRPTNDAPCGAQPRTTASRSAKSPMPQFDSERSV